MDVTIFEAIVTVDEVSLHGGRHERSIYGYTNIEMSGTILRLNRLGFRELREKTTRVSVLVNQDNEIYPPLEEPDRFCIGDLTIIEQENPSSDYESHFSVSLEVSVSRDTIDHIIVFHNFRFSVEVFFWRDKQSLTPLTLQSGSSTKHYVKRIVFSPIFPERG